MATKFKQKASSAIIILIGLMTIFSLSGLFFVSNQSQSALQNQNSQQSNLPPMEKITLTTSDNKTIAADYFPVDQAQFTNPAGWAVLTHMMPATKESWNSLANDLQNNGFESIAIDLRGHGESEGGPNGYLKFSNKDTQKSILDIAAAVNYLESKGATPDKIFLIGASIGANLSLEYLAENGNFPAAILFSPGLNYKGIEAAPLIEKLKLGQKVVFITSKDDGSNNSEVQALYGKVPAGVAKETKSFQFGGHGTDILKSHPDLNDLVINYLQ